MSDTETLRIEMGTEENELDFYIRAMGEIATSANPAGVLIEPRYPPRAFYKTEAIKLLKRWKREYEEEADPDKFRQGIEKIVNEAATALKRARAIDEILKKLNGNKQEAP